MVPVFFLLAALSPFLLSSSSVLHFFLAAVNKNISGSISMDSWLIGWQQGILCQNVVYTDPDKGISVSISSLTSNRGLMEIILAPKNFGVVQVESPQVELSGSSLQSFFTDDNTVDSGVENSPRLLEDETPVWDNILVDLKARDGQMKVKWIDQNVTLTFNNVSVDATLAAGIASFELGFHALDQGFVEVAGSLNLPAHEYGWLETIIAETEVKVSSLQLRDFLQAGSIITELPQGEGVVNADLRLKAVGIDGLELNGLAELTDVKLQGGFLGKDQPSFQKVYLTVAESKWTGHGWSAKDFEIASDTLNMKASGKFFSETKELAAQGVLNIPVLFDQFPRLLRVNESTFLETGTLDFTLELVESSPDASIKFKAKADNIGGIFQDERFSWDSAVLLLLNGEKKGMDLQVSALQFDAPFGRAKGSGGLHSFSVDAVLDLDKAFADIGTLFQLELSGSGKMDMTVKSDLAENEEGLIKIDSDLNISDFMLLRGQKPFIPLHQFSLIGGFEAPDTFFTHNNGEFDFQVVLSSWLGDVFLVVNGEKTEGIPFKGYYTTDTEIDLIQLSSLLHNVDLFSSESQIGGTLQLQAAGFVGVMPVEIRDLSVEIKDFVVEGNDAVFTDPLIKLTAKQPVNDEVSFLSLRKLKVVDSRQAFFRNGAGLNLLDFPNRDITLHNVRLQSAAGTVSLESLVIPDWHKPLDSVTAQFSLSADLGKMTEGFQSFGWLPLDMAFSGVSQVSLLLAEKGDAMQEMQLDVQLTDFGLEHQRKTVIDSEDVLFSSHLQGQIPFGAMSVEELKLESGILELDATGNVSNVDAKQLLEIRGSMIPALDKIAAILGKEFDSALTMTGQQEEQVILQYPLWKKPAAGITQLGVYSSFHPDTLVVNGVELREVALPFHFDNSKLHMELSSRMNEGRFDIVTDTDFTAAPAVIMTPGNSRIMTGVKLNDPLVATLFSKIHPLFGVFAQPSGMIDVRLDSLWWPIGASRKEETNFVTILDVRDIQLEKLAILNNILLLFGLEKERLQLRDNEIYCIGKNGQLKCSPVRVMAGEVEVIVGGSVYDDSSLDYEVEVPVTKKLVSDEEYRILQGTTVRVAVKGTNQIPYFDREKVVNTLQNLMKQAAEKIVQENERTK